MTPAAIPVAVDDPVNTRILAVSEDRVTGFSAEPFQEIARLSGVELSVVVERIRAMLGAGVVRRVRQTLMATNLAAGALIAWLIPEDKLTGAFDFMYQQDPFTGHVVIRSTDAPGPGSDFRLWTTLKVPRGFSLERHCEFLGARTGAARYHIMPARRLFVVGVGHVRRTRIAPGTRTEELAAAQEPEAVELSERDWRVLMPLKREFGVAEIVDHPWAARAREAGVSLEEFCAVARSLNERGVIGRFSTFLEHTKPHNARNVDEPRNAGGGDSGNSGGGARVASHNALFHWAVPPGREVEAGRQIGRHVVLTHLYWRDGGPEFGNANIMGVVHGNDKALVLRHKAAIDEHLASVGVPLLHTNAFWSVRAEIKPSEIAPDVYEQWSRRMGL